MWEFDAICPNKKHFFGLSWSQEIQGESSLQMVIIFTVNANIFYTFKN